MRCDAMQGGVVSSLKRTHQAKHGYLGLAGALAAVQSKLSLEVCGRSTERFRTIYHAAPLRNCAWSRQ